ncbi:MAG TPA: hypothetical protein VMK83_06255 [Gaiellaceae bacterium]|nr:hypothetical protein [Gaiellaceae bacterium]
MGAFGLAAAVLVLSAGCAYPAASRLACADAVLDDWTKGALGATYSADCYDAAIDALPEDLRAYTTAADDISRAAVAASRADVPQRQLAAATVENGELRAFPLQVVLLAALVALLVTGGTVASLIRRRRAR